MGMEPKERRVRAMPLRNEGQQGNNRLALSGKGQAFDGVPLTLISPPKDNIPCTFDRFETGQRFCVPLDLLQMPIHLQP